MSLPSFPDSWWRLPDLAISDVHPSSQILVAPRPSWNIFIAAPTLRHEACGPSKEKSLDVLYTTLDQVLSHLPELSDFLPTVEHVPFSSTMDTFPCSTLCHKKNGQSHNTIGIFFIRKQLKNYFESAEACDLEKQSNPVHEWSLYEIFYEQVQQRWRRLRKQ